MSMIRRKQSLIYLAGVLAAGSAVGALTDNNPYHPIIDRNAFALRPPPPPVNTIPQVVEIPANIKFTGITSSGGRKTAWFMIPAKDATKPVEYYNVIEGEINSDGKGGIEVTKIIEEKGEVQINFGGKPMTLSFDKNGLKPVAVATAPVPMPLPPGSPIPMPVPNQPQVAPSGGTAVPIQGGGGMTVPQPSAQPGRVIPGRQLRVSPQTPATSQTQGPASLEEAVVMVEIQREITKDAVAKKQLPPLPPTPMSFPTPDE